jgi:hypothetical protein
VQFLALNCLLKITAIITSDNNEANRFLLNSISNDNGNNDSNENDIANDVFNDLMNKINLSTTAMTVATPFNENLGTFIKYLY